MGVGYDRGFCMAAGPFQDAMGQVRRLGGMAGRWGNPACRLLVRAERLV